MSAHLIQYLLVAQIKPDPTQPRKSYDPEALARMAETIKLDGVEQPIRVRPAEGSDYQIIFGERRWAASKLAGKDTIPAFVEEARQDAARLRLRRLVVDCGHEPLRPLDLAGEIEAAMTEEELTAAEVAARIGLSEGHVSKLRALRRELPPEMQGAVARGELGLKAAYEMIAAGKGRGAAERLARKVASSQRTARAPRQKVTLPVDKGCSLSVMAPELSLQSLLAWLSNLTERARLAESSGLTLAAFADSLRPAKRLKKGGAA